MIAELQLGTDLSVGALVLLAHRAHRDVPLHWQTWALDSRRLNRMSETIREHSRRQLRQ
jgi:LysR family transcriptional regulator (chromosome initiation inhibitor)